jgi:hypothetical protein
MSYNPVILVSSCQRDMDRGFHRAIEETWGKDPAIPFFFLVGNTFLEPPRPLFRRPNTIALPVPDDYKSLPLKTREGHRWALRQGYDFVFQAFTDTYCFTRRMEATGWARTDYMGHFRGEEVPQLGKVNPGCYACGGSGYWMSPFFSERLIEEEPDHWAEDLWVGRVAAKHGVKGTQDYRFHSGGGYKETALTVHLSRGTDNYQAQWMYDTHETARRRGEL